MILMDSHFSQHVYNESTEGFAHARRKHRRLARRRTFRTTRGACRPRKIDYPGANNNSQFSYDGRGCCAEILEKAGGSTISTRQLVRSTAEPPFKPSMIFRNRTIGVFQPDEERDSNDLVVKKFFENGQINSSTAYFYTCDHLNSVREFVDVTGNVQTYSSFTPFGQIASAVGVVSSDIGYAGYFAHTRSGLDLTLNRALSTLLGRWTSRDPIEELGGSNLYAYVSNKPVAETDPSGLAAGIVCPSLREWCEEQCRIDRDACFAMCDLLYRKFSNSWWRCRHRCWKKYWDCMFVCSFL